MRMYFGQGEMTEDEPHLPAKIPLHLVDHWMRYRTMRAFIVAVFHKRDWSQRRPRT